MKTVERLLLTAFCLAVLAAVMTVVVLWAKRAQTESAPAVVKDVATGRITWEYASNIEGYRPVYVLRDTKTGHEYIAIAGVGIALIPPTE